MRVADYIAKTLERKGVTHAFGVIGAGNVALFDAITRHAKTQIVCCHHEQAAVMAAGFWARARPGTGCAIVTTGAGSANAVTGALSALMDSCPVVILSGNEPSQYLLGDTRVIGVQGFHTERVAVPVSKAGYVMHHGTGQAALIDHCFTEATTPRFGPVWLDIPRDLFLTGVR